MPNGDAMTKPTLPRHFEAQASRSKAGNNTGSQEGAD
jgi:hypothetical protein